MLLAGSGVEIRVLDVRMVGDGNGQERILVGVEPLRAAGGSAGSTGSGSAGGAGSAPVEDGGRPVVACYINEILKEAGFKTALFTTAVIEIASLFLTKYGQFAKIKLLTRGISSE